MKYNKIDSSLFIKNRKNFVKKLESNSIAFFNSNDIYPVSADSELPFEQHRDIFHLTGIFGILYGNSEWFINLTPLNLSVSFFLLVFVNKNYFT